MSTFRIEVAYNRKSLTSIPMQRQYLTKYSIKQKIHTETLMPSNETTLLPRSKHTATRRVFTAVQSHFIQTLDKEIQHEGQILKRLKSKISNFKSEQRNRRKIKNAFSYSHHCFNSYASQNKRGAKPRIVRTAIATPNSPMPNEFAMSSQTKVDSPVSKAKVSSFSVPRSRDMSNHQENRPATSGFVRSSKFCQQKILQYTTDGFSTNDTFNPNRKQWKNQKPRCKRPTEGFVIIGGRPLWRNFESYRGSTPALSKLVL